jgi:hypothetical protein
MDQFDLSENVTHRSRLGIHGLSDAFREVMQRTRGVDAKKGKQARRSRQCVEERSDGRSYTPLSLPRLPFPRYVQLREDSS